MYTRKRMIVIIFRKWREKKGEKEGGVLGEDECGRKNYN